MHPLTNLIRTRLGLQLKEAEKEQGFKCLEGDYWGFPDGQYMSMSGHTVLYEIEEGQQHPCTNVLKYWPVLEENSSIKIILIQWLTKKLKSKNRWLLAKFVAKKISAAFPNRFEYVFLEFDDSENEMKLEKLKLQIHNIGRL